MVKIRLKRTGTKKRPCYRLVVADARSPRDGKFIEAVGFYDPLPSPAVIRVNRERIEHWLGHGARPSDSARMLLEHEGILPKTVRQQVPRKKAEVVAEPAKSTAHAASAAEEKIEGSVMADSAEMEDEAGAVAVAVAAEEVAGNE